jgi:hypothetical protein
MGGIGVQSAMQTAVDGEWITAYYLTNRADGSYANGYRHLTKKSHLWTTDPLSWSDRLKLASICAPSWRCVMRTTRESILRAVARLHAVGIESASEFPSGDQGATRQHRLVVISGDDAILAGIKLEAAERCTRCKNSSHSRLCNQCQHVADVAPALPEVKKRRRQPSVAEQQAAYLERGAVRVRALQMVVMFGLLAMLTMLMLASMAGECTAEVTLNPISNAVVDVLVTSDSVIRGMQMDLYGPGTLTGCTVFDTAFTCDFHASGKRLRILWTSFPPATQLPGDKVPTVRLFYSGPMIRWPRLENILIADNDALPCVVTGPEKKAKR